MHDDLVYPVGYVRKHRRPLDDEDDFGEDPDIPPHGPGPP
jgi:hypothetical protein